MADFLYWFFTTPWPHLLFAGTTGLAIWASSHVVLTKRDPRAALGWVGVIWLTPIVGSLLYYFFGINRIERKARSLRKPKESRGSSPATPLASEELLHRFFGDEALHLTSLARYVDKLTDTSLVDGNLVQPLVTGQIAYDAMLAAIDAAERSVALETYIFDNDPCGQRFVEALARAQSRGCQIRVLIDDVGARYTFPSIKHALRKAGLRFATFLPTLLPSKLHYSNLRSHRKILVVDGNLAFTGGMNIRQGHLCEPEDKHPIHDLHFRVTGPVVDHLRDTLSADWEFATGEVLDGPLWQSRLECTGQSLCRGIADGPDTSHDKLRLTILGAIGCARRSIEICTPYFLPEQPMITALNVAAMRGVAVHIILPEKNNLALVQWASTAQLWQVLQRGCRVWLSPPPFDHTKLMIVDGVWSLFGSANWDPRSLRLNFECNVECYDRDVAAQLSALFHEKRARSRETSLAEVDNRPLWMRLRDGYCRLALPYL